MQLAVGSEQSSDVPRSLPSTTNAAGSKSLKSCSADPFQFPSLVSLFQMANSKDTWTKTNAVPTATQPRDCVKLQQHGKDNEACSTRDGSEDVRRARRTESCLVKRGLFSPRRQHNLRTGKKRSLHLLARGIFFLAWATPRATRAACFESYKMRTRSSRGDKGINPSEGFSKTSELSRVVAVRGST